jgi:hypothetical protein
VPVRAERVKKIRSAAGARTRALVRAIPERYKPMIMLARCALL